MIFRSFALSSKDTTVKRQPTEWENIANHTFDERLLPRELTQQLKKKNPTGKVDKELEQTLLQSCANGQ